MKYYTQDLCDRLNSDDETIRMEADRAWNENVSQYQSQFQKTKKYLSRRFVKGFLAHHGFHDYVIDNMTLERVGRKYNFKIKMAGESGAIQLTMFHVQAVQVGIDSFQYCILGKLSWLYSEFERTEAGLIGLSLLCDGGNEMRFEFENLKFKELTESN